VRVVNGLTDAAKINATLGNTSFSAVASPSISDYMIVPAGKHAFAAAKTKASFTIAAGKYYSILLSSTAAQLTEDALIRNPAKTQLYFYNLSDSAKASVFATKQKVAIVKDVATGKAASREMNALTLAVDVKAGDTTVKNFSDVALKRRIGTSFLLAGKKNTYQAIMVNNAVKR
jgi:alginate O-acetyltransferase complex protein AlgF